MFDTNITNVRTDKQLIKYANDSQNNILGTLKADIATNKIYSGTKLPLFYSEGKIGSATLAKPHIYVSDLFVSKLNRKKGIGKGLIYSIIEESKKLGFEGRIVLLAGSNEDSPLPFYKKLGFISDDKRLNLQLDDCLRYKTPFDSKEQAFMFLPKKAILRILKFIRV